MDINKRLFNIGYKSKEINSIINNITSIDIYIICNIVNVTLFERFI